MGERVIKVNRNEFYKPVHDKTIEGWERLGKKYQYTAWEKAEAKFWDFFRYSDDTYRFNVQLIQINRILDERDNQEYLTRVWRIYGKSEIGNEKSWIKEYAVDTYDVPIYDTQVVQKAGSQSLTTEAGEITGKDLRYTTPFTIDNVIIAFKDSLPEYNLRYVTLHTNTHQGRNSIPVDKKYFLAWLLAPMEFIAEYQATGNKALLTMGIDDLPNRYKNMVTEFQKEKLKKMIEDSNILFIEEEEKKILDEESQKMEQQGIKNETPAKTTVKVKEEKQEVVTNVRKQY